MEISQHIKNLLMTNDRVILGGFGAFDSKHIPARIDKETKTMTPPHKIIVFNPDFTQDEGILAKEMAEKEGISLNSANEQISEYVKTIKTKLDNGQKVVFKDLGEFRKEGDKYEFSYLSKDNLLVDSFGLPKVSLTEQDKKNIPPKKDTGKEPLKTVKKDEQKPKSSPKPTVKKEVKKKPVIKQKQVKTQKGKKKKKLFWPVFLIIIGLLGILLVAVYFFKPDLWKKGYTYSSDKIAVIKSSIFGDKKDDLEIITPEDENTETSEVNEDSTQTEIVSEDTTSTEDLSENNTENVNEESSDISENNTQTEEVVDNQPDEVESNISETTVNTNTVNASSGKYYIIIGSVKTKAAADKEQKRYAAKGISTSILYAEKMDRYRISIGEFSSAKAAQDFFTEFQNKHGSIDAWVWEKR